MDYEVSLEETEPLLYLLFTTCAYYPFQLVLNTLLNQVCFAWQAARQNAEMLRFAAMRAFIHKAPKQGDGRTSLIFTCLKAMDLSIKGVKNKETRWYELKGAKWKRGKVIGERCGNCHSAQV